MKLNFIKRIALILIATLAYGAAIAQQMPPVPVDTAVRIGKLPNGLTYYIRHNETPKGQADFYIAQKVGSILEEDNQRGLAHFLEHMCFNGTSHFPGNSLIDWLETVGVKFGQNLNAYTSVDETVYNISNVPVARTGVQDSCLLILHDWANDLLLDPEEIDKERGVIHQEWRRSNVGQMRILEKLLPVMYPDNRYGYRLPIGTMEVIDNFPPQVLRDYYETWYRPDQQGIIVVGDIDVDYIEGKIKEIFSDIEMPENAKVREYLTVADTPGTIYAIGSDPEQTVGVAELMFKTDAFPNEMKGTMQYLMSQYILNMITDMLDQRLDDISNRPDAPFAQAGTYYSNYFVSKTKDALTLSAVAKDNDVLPGLETAYRELLRAARGGFTQGEYERARAEYLSALEKTYNGRDKRQSGSYVKEYVRNFIDNEPIPSLEDEYQMMQQLANMIPVEAINSILPQLVLPDNRVLLVLAPENGQFKVPTEAELAEMIAKVDAEDIEPYLDEMKSEPLIPALPTPGKVVSIDDDAQWGAKVVTLSNGVKVWVKTTDFKKDEIRFVAEALGGTSEIGDEQAADLLFLPVAMSQNGLGTYTNSDLKKYLQGKQASVNVSFDNYNRELSGSSTVKDLPTLFELIYMTFADFTIDADEYKALQNMYSSVLANQEANPQFIFQKDLMASLYQSPASQLISVDVINSASRDNIVNIVKNGMSNAADYDFFFVGDVDVETLIPLLEQYIATLPADSSKAVKSIKTNKAREMNTGSANDTFTTKMETPQTWCAIIVNGVMPDNVANKKISSMAGQMLSNRLLKKIREEMGAVYSIHGSCFMSRLGDVNTFVQIPFPMKPELKDDVLKEIHQILSDMTTNISDEELAPVKEFMVKEAVEGKEKNEQWISQMSATKLNGVDTFNGDVEAINGVTVTDVQNFMKQLMDQGNYRVVILDPAQ